MYITELILQIYNIKEVSCQILQTANVTLGRVNSVVFA